MVAPDSSCRQAFVGTALTSHTETYLPPGSTTLNGWYCYVIVVGIIIWTRGAYTGTDCFLKGTSCSAYSNEVGDHSNLLTFAETC
jgi:hypothetical protein